MLDEARAADDCFRIGGDEFAILDAGDERRGAGVAAERIAARVCEAGLGAGAVGVSYGIAAAADLDAAGLTAAADRELLAAKDRLYGRA